RSAFADRFSSRLGLLALLIASVGAFLVGTYPEPSTELGGHIHAYVSLVTFLGSGISLLFFALAMLRDTRWEGFRGYTGLSGMVTLVALAVFAAWATNTGSAGLVERLIVAPILLWAFVAGLHLLRLRVFAPDRLLQHLSA
ncbi:MAG TPA: DUF998 domain-containing protein, partial [Thermoplasmata archaeon]|nr:DUF998 domain-containing protein [Thermoplasmata archaeon]